MLTNRFALPCLVLCAWAFARAAPRLNTKIQTGVFNFGLLYAPAVQPDLYQAIYFLGVSDFNRKWNTFLSFLVRVIKIVLTLYIIAVVVSVFHSGFSEHSFHGSLISAITYEYKCEYMTRE